MTTTERCRYIKKANKNRELYGYATTPAQRKCQSKYAKKKWESTRILNLAMYGYATTPEIRKRSREQSAKQRVRNLELYGTAKTPEELGKERRRKVILRKENRRVYGTATPPEELVLVREKERKKRDENRRLYGQAVPPERCIELHNRMSELRSRVMYLYGGRCSCCGESRPEVLTFDHINGNGKTSRNRSSAGLVKAALTAFNECGYPNNKYRLLCWNCNTSIGYYGYCPHNAKPHNPQSVRVPVNRNVKANRRARRRNHRIRLEMIEAYGGKCALCGEAHQEFLTLDHINGDGAQHRRSLGSSGRNTCYVRAMLRRLGWPKDNYRLLCSNCNSGKIAMEAQGKIGGQGYEQGEGF